MFLRIASRPFGLVAFFFLTATTYAQTVHRADDFVAKFQTMLHIHHKNTPYNAKFTAAKNGLIELGVRQLRRGFNVGLNPAPGSWGETVINRHLDLYQNAGIRYQFAVLGDITNTANAAASLEFYTTHFPEDAIARFEGRNEVHWKPGGDGTPEKADRDNAVNYQIAWRDAIRNHPNPDIANKKIVGFSTVASWLFVSSNDDRYKLACDWVNVHDYPKGYTPEGQYARAANHLNRADIGDKEWIFTEAAYGSRYDCYPNSFNVDKTTQAKYELRFLAEQFKGGRPVISRSVFMDKVVGDCTDSNDGKFQHLGYMWGDGEKKPVFYAVKNLFSMLNESIRSGSNWSRPAFNPTPLPFTVDKPDIRHVTLQKASQVYYILVWKEEASWDFNNNQPIAPSSTGVTFDFDEDMYEVKAFQPFNETDPTAGSHLMKTQHNTRSVYLNVKDNLIVLQVRKLSSHEPQSVGTVDTLSVEVDGMVEIPTSIYIPFYSKENVIFTSNNPEIATVDENGLVTGISSGTAIIEVASQFNPEAVSTVEVTVEGGLSLGDCEFEISDFVGATEIVAINEVTYRSFERNKGTYVIGIAAGIRTDGQAGAWEIHSDCSVKTIRRTGQGDNTTLLPDVKGVEKYRGWNYVPTSISEDGQFIYATAINQNGFTHKRGWTVEAGTEVEVRFQLGGAFYGRIFGISSEILCDDLNVETFAGNYFVTGCNDGSETFSTQSASSNETLYQVYPNPVNNSFSLKGASEASDLNLQIFDLSGNLVMSTIANTSQAIDVSRLIPGVYLVKIYQDGEEIVQTKLVKK